MTDDLVVLFHFDVVLRDPRPVSVNKLYGNNGYGGRRLTTEGGRFKAALIRAVATTTAVMYPPWSEAIDCVYKYRGWVHLEIHLYLKKVYNRSWKLGGSMTSPRKPRKRKDGVQPPAPVKTKRSPYQKVDATNYIKLIEDAVATGTAIDDSAHLFVSVSKQEDQDDPRIEITYRICE